MVKLTAEKLTSMGYKIENAKIRSVDLSMEDHGVLCLEMSLDANTFGVVFGGMVLGKGYVGAKEFSSYPHASEYLMQIMDVVGCSRFNDMEGKYIRVATDGWGNPVRIIGNIIEDKWFDADSFFADFKEEENTDE